MKRFLKALVISLLATVIFYGSALASWVFLYPINIIETANTTRSYYPVIFEFGGTQLVNQGLISSNGTDTNIQIGASNAKFMISTTNICAVVPSIAAGSVTTLSLYTGYSPLQPYFSIIPGYGGNVTVANSPNLAIGANFSSTYIGYLDTTKNGTFWNELNSYSYNTSSNGSVIFSANASSTVASVNLTPDGAGTTENITSFNGSATHWQTQLTNDGGNSTVYATTLSVDFVDTYSTQNISNTNLGVSNVTIYFTGARPGSSDGRGKAVIKTHGTLYYGSEFIFANPAFTTGNFTWTTNPFTGVAWTIQEVNDMEIGIDIYLPGAGTLVENTQVLARISFTNNTVTLTANNEPASHYEVTTNVSSGNLSLYIDGVLKDTTIFSGMTVNSNSNNITLMASANNSYPYADNITLTVNNTIVLWLNPNVMLISNTIPDRSGLGNTGTINRGANSGLSIVVGEPTSFSSATAVANQTAGFAVGGATMPSTWYAHGENLANLPFYDAFQNVANQDGRPVQFYYMLGAFGLALGVFIMLVIFTRSALIGYISMLVVLGISSSMTIVPAWLVFALAVVGVSIMYLYGQFRTGG